MPQNKSAVIRYQVIDKCLTGKQKKYPDLAYLAAKCADVLGTAVAESTIEKDIRAMRESPALGYNAPIAYSKAKKGYYYSELGYSIRELSLEEEEWEALRYAASLLFQYKDIPVFAHFKSAIERINSRFDIGLDWDDPFLPGFIEYEKGNSFVGYSWLAGIFSAIRYSQLIRFTYENIYRSATGTYELHPYLLKEVRNRWYVIGWSEVRSQYITFALDRIKELTLLPGKQKKRNDFDPELFFRYSIGITEAGGHPVSVRMKIKPPFSNLVKLEPLHHSQSIVNEKAEFIVIEIKVALTPELYQKILSLGPHCTVLKPGKAAEEVKRLLNESMENYK